MTQNSIKRNVMIGKRMACIPETEISQEIHQKVILKMYLRNSASPSYKRKGLLSAAKPTVDENSWIMARIFLQIVENHIHM